VLINDENLIASGYSKIRENKPGKGTPGSAVCLFSFIKLVMAGREKHAYSIMLYKWEFPIGGCFFVSSARFDTGKVTFLVDMQLYDDSTIEELETFLSSIYIQMKCLPNR